MKFRLSSLLGVMLVSAILAAWWVERASLQRSFVQADSDATRLATELYIHRVVQLHAKPHGSRLPPGTRGFYSTTSDIIDVTTPAGRHELLLRLEGNEISFRIRTAGGRIVAWHDLPAPSWLNDAGPDPNLDRMPKWSNNLVPKWIGNNDTQAVADSLLKQNARATGKP